MASYDPPECLSDADQRDVGLMLSRDVRSLMPDFAALGLNEIEARIAVEVVRATMQGRRVSYSRRKDWYRERADLPHGITYARVVGAFDRIAALGLIDHFRQVPGVRGVQSHAIAKAQLLNLVRPLLLRGPLPFIRPRSPIILRDSERKSLPLPCGRELDRMARQIENVNEAMAAVQVKTGDGLEIGAPMCRIYNVDFEHGGRLYGQGTSWQNLPKVQRKAITMDGEGLEELDFRCLHPAMLYYEAGAAMPRDAYDIGSGWSRPLVKVAMLAAINAPNRHSARGAIAWQDHMSPLADPGSQTALGLADKLLTALWERHRAIAGAFFSGVGLRLMRRDSDLALRVICLMMARGIVVLAVHDWTCPENVESTN